MVCALLAVVALGAAASAALGSRPPEPRRGGELCGAFEVAYPFGQPAAIRTFDAGWALEHPRRFGANAVIWSWARGGGRCDELRALMVDILRATDELVGLERHGWRVELVQRQRIGGVRFHEVTARRGDAWIVYDRRGAHPRVDPEIIRPGQFIGFPRSDKTCTAGWLLRLRATGQIVGSATGHCADPEFSGGEQADVPERFRRVGGRTVTQPLGPVLQNAHLDEHLPDALAYSLFGVPLAAQQVDHRGGPPYRVVGVLPLPKQRKGRVVCFNGFGIPRSRCGRIVGRDSFLARPVTCVDRRSVDGASGGPVYTKPNRFGEVRAVGEITRRTVFRDRMCFTPIQETMEALGATFPLGSFAPSSPG